VRSDAPSKLVRADWSGCLWEAFFFLGHERDLSAPCRTFGTSKEVCRASRGGVNDISREDPVGVDTDVNQTSDEMEELLLGMGTGEDSSAFGYLNLSLDDIFLLTMRRGAT
jgi:hypothetical protein